MLVCICAFKKQIPVWPLRIQHLVMKQVLQTKYSYYGIKMRTCIAVDVVKTFVTVYLLGSSVSTPRTKGSSDPANPLKTASGEYV